MARVRTAHEMWLGIKDPGIWCTLPVNADLQPYTALCLHRLSSVCQRWDEDGMEC